MKFFKSSTYIIILFAAFCSNAFGQKISYKPGNGLHISSSENKWDFLFSGYINSIYSYHSVNQNSSIQNSFNVHRARLDLGFDYMHEYDVFLEFDAAGQRTQMVLAQIQARLFKQNYILAGKFINPFSAENNRSTSRLTTVERYSALNSVFLLPGLDTQFGVMFFGSSSKFDYYLSLMNGNGEAAQNIPENNNGKEFTARLDYNASPSFKAGASVDYSTERSQILSLVDHTFESFSNANVNGKRFGYLGNFEFKNNPFLIRGEAFVYSFEDNLSMINQVKNFAGGYLELGYFLSGDEADGVQLIGRFETARFGSTVINFSGPAELNSYLLGTNWYLRNIFSFQVNVIFEKTDRPSAIPLSRLTGRENETLLLTTFQLRF